MLNIILISAASVSLFIMFGTVIYRMYVHTTSTSFITHDSSTDSLIIKSIPYSEVSEKVDNNEPVIDSANGPFTITPQKALIALDYSKDRPLEVTQVVKYVNTSTSELRTVSIPLDRSKLIAHVEEEKHATPYSSALNIEVDGKELIELIASYLDKAHKNISIVKLGRNFKAAGVQQPLVLIAPLGEGEYILNIYTSSLLAILINKWKRLVPIAKEEKKMGKDIDRALEELFSQKS